MIKQPVTVLQGDSLDSVVPSVLAGSLPQRGKAGPQVDPVMEAAQLHSSLSPRSKETQLRSQGPQQICPLGGVGGPNTSQLRCLPLCLQEMLAINKLLTVPGHSAPQAKELVGA